MIYTNKGMLLDKVLCDVIPSVCPLIDHASRPTKALEFLTLLYHFSWTIISAATSGRVSATHVARPHRQRKEISGSFKNKRNTGEKIGKCQ